MTHPSAPKRRIPEPKAFTKFFLLLASVSLLLAPAKAETPVERGSYLVNTILACGNCHTPKTPEGDPIAEKELSGGGISFTTPAFNAVAANITPDKETGIGLWSDEDIKRALTEGQRPSHARPSSLPLAVCYTGFPLLGARLHINAARRQACVVSAPFLQPGLTAVGRDEPHHLVNVGRAVILSRSPPAIGSPGPMQ